MSDPEPLEDFSGEDDLAADGFQFHRCRGCGCTDEFSCEPEGCEWVEPDLCSACDFGDDPAFHVHGIKRAFQEIPRARRIA